MRKMWENYKHRFVPWIAFNWRTRVTKFKDQEIELPIPEDEIVFKQLENLFNSFSGNNNKKYDDRLINSINSKVMLEKFGFCIEKRKSKLPQGGTGVVVSDGTVCKGNLVALYPGTIYRHGDPIFFQSIGNSFILKCVDGIHLDGNDKRISKSIFKSCVFRDKIGPHFTADVTWLGPFPLNPLNVGQYVNNQSSEFPCNVVYQEYDIPDTFPVHLRKFIPNIYFGPADLHSSTINSRLTRIVALIAVKDITQGEELFSSYFSIVK